jgi:hypothetical protein
MLKPVGFRHGNTLPVDLTGLATTAGFGVEPSLRFPQLLHIRLAPHAINLGGRIFFSAIQACTVALVIPTAAAASPVVSFGLMGAHATTMLQPVHIGPRSRNSLKMQIGI